MVFDELARAKEIEKSLGRSTGAMKKALQRRRPATCVKIIGQINICFRPLDPFSINLSKESRRRAGVTGSRCL
jgi:hypothetical protein